MSQLEPFDFSKYEPEENPNRVVQPLIQLQNKCYYKGEWDVETGKRDGRGAQVWPDGGYYEGYWTQDYACGKGRMIYTDGDVYEGMWKDNLANGYGKALITSLNRTILTFDNQH